MSEVLGAILEEATAFGAQGRKFLAVFDLDSTVFDLTVRVTSILTSFRESPENQLAYPSECARLERVEVQQGDWGIDESLARVGLSSETDFFAALQAHWVRGFFANDYLPHDVPVAGAVEYVRALSAAGAHIMYLTGRDIARMGVGTELSLRQHSFPQGELVLKPDARLDDAEFKLEVLREAASQYERIWLFENEPVNLNLIARELPSVGLVFIETTHSRREEPLAGMARIAHFARGG